MNHNDPFELYDEKREPLDDVMSELRSRWNTFLADFQFIRCECIYGAIVDRWHYNFITQQYENEIGGDDDEGII